MCCIGLLALHYITGIYLLNRTKWGQIIQGLAVNWSKKNLWITDKEKYQNTLVLLLGYRPFLMDWNVIDYLLLLVNNDF